jgi:hypothetical protein
MTGFLNNVSSRHEHFALVMGVLSVLISTFFFLWWFNVIKVDFSMDTEIMLLFFAGFNLLSGLILLLTTIGFIGVKGD